MNIMNTTVTWLFRASVSHKYFSIQINCKDKQEYWKANLILVFVKWNPIQKVKFERLYDECTYCSITLLLRYNHVSYLVKRTKLIQ